MQSFETPRAEHAVFTQEAALLPVFAHEAAAKPPGWQALIFAASNTCPEKNCFLPGQQWNRDCPPASS